MNAVYFAKQVKAEAMQAIESRDMAALKFDIVNAVAMKKSKVEVITTLPISSLVTNALDDEGITVLFDNVTSEGTTFTTFDLTGLEMQ
ncbi:hypothetical protein FD13_GL001027 [Levilactobacillus senmaizukei DSM 21775 = NBRC 103853]|uniref:Uncharacterized protein n=1 Tax=Levilactobacillus senmaizukei DSM 21775 = NBRC 103853 TaxID=1423803 RepID=A0A0R2DMF9_9LACO|nr:hypothetical protein [Levilactobacillus senmaizukei]KRN01436.1 hypothetical protein FD13_GL001027 [Levilactobacillus senmaizukei DSM 21775 = NBRC 103853]